MSLGEEIQADLVTAMRAKDAFRPGALRLIKTAFKNKEVEKRSPLSEDEERGVLQTLQKQRREAAAQFRHGDRLELADKEEQEAALIQEYLPSPATEDEMRAAVEGGTRAFDQEFPSSRLDARPDVSDGRGRREVLRRIGELSVRRRRQWLRCRHALQGAGPHERSGEVPVRATRLNG